MNKEDLIKLGLSPDYAETLVETDKQKSEKITKLEDKNKELQGKIDELTSAVEGEKERREKIENQYKQQFENSSQDVKEEPKTIFDEIINA